jgi:hypothetical protein
VEVVVEIGKRMRGDEEVKRKKRGEEQGDTGTRIRGDEDRGNTEKEEGELN